MRDTKTQQGKNGQERPGISRIDVWVVLFLIFGWVIIFVVATWGLRREAQLWIPVNLVARASADYGVDAQAPVLAPIDPEIIEAVKEDDKIREANRTPTPETAVLVAATATPTPTPSPTTTPGLLTVSAGGPYAGEEGSPVTLTAENFSSVLNLLPSTITYRWDLDGDGLFDDAAGKTTSFTFYDEGDYAIAVQATDLLGRIARDSTVANILNVPPVLQIGEDIFADEAEEVTFAAVATDPGDDVLLYDWDFGDGSNNINNTLRPRHAYGDDGRYVVTLRVRDNDGGETQDSLTVFVDNLNPEVEAGPDQVVDEGSQVTLSGFATDPAGTNDPLTYAWDLDYNGRNFRPDLDGQTVAARYDDGPDNFVVALGVMDDDDGRSIDTLNIAVRNVPPVITRVSNNGPVGEGRTINLTVEATDVGADTLTYAFDWNNDGNFDTSQQPGNASNIWPDQGDHVVGIRVNDGDGGEAFTTTVVSTFNLTPTAVAQTTQISYIEGSPVPFDGSDSSDPGINDSLTYVWDFGDGSTGSGEQTSHIYGDNDVYTATLTVSDNSGAADTDTLAVTVVNANPTGEAGPDQLVDEGTNVQLIFGGTNIDDPGADTLTIDWDFDYDGVFNPQASGQSVSWTYDSLDGPTEKQVAMRVRDDDYPASTDNGGEIGQIIDILNVTVENVSPESVDARGPYSGIVGSPVSIAANVATDVPADILTYEWDLDYNNGNFDVDRIGRAITNTWNTFGTFNIAVRVSDEDGGERIDTAVVNINSVPGAEAGGPYTQLEGNSIIFDGSASSDLDNDPLTYLWRFGDGSPAKNGITVTHIYRDNNVYTATLTVTDIDGSSTQDRATVTIHNANPIIQPLSDATTLEGAPLPLIGAATDPGTADTLTFAWDTDYDGTTFTEDQTGASIFVEYPDGPATYEVALRVRDDDYPYPTGQGGQIGEDLEIFQVEVLNAAPTIDAQGPYLGVEGQLITLSGLGDDVPDDTLSYAWDLDNNGVPETPGQTVVNSWSTGGVYTVSVTVTDEDGAFATDTARVIVNSVPLADAGGPYTGDENSAVTFNGSASSDPDGDPLIYTWNFGDGSAPVTGVDPNVTHTYRDNGDYTVTLTVDDNRGGIDTATTTATINNLPPTANPGGPYSGDENSPITFNGGGSSDPGPSDTLSYLWNFGDGNTATGVSPTYTYPDDGSFTLTLTVTDGDGGSDVATTSVTISNVDPVANAQGPYSTTVAVPITLTGSGADVPADSLTYAWDFNYDGVNFNVDRSGQTVTNTWSITGVQTIALRVTDDDGGFDIDSTTVDVGRPPTANPGGPYTANENAPVTFNGSASSDPDGDPLIYTWNFGDGSPTAAGITSTHTYLDNGVYTVTLTVNDNRGGVDTAVTTATINNLSPTANPGGPYNGDENSPITFNGGGSSDPSPSDTLSYLWDFGDGNTATGANPNHAYRDNGTYTVTLTVTDNDGASDSSSLTVDVANLSPVANIGGPYGGDEGTAIVFDGSSSSDPGPDDVLTYSWDFGDGNTAAGVNPTHTYLDNGDYTVILSVTDDDGAVDQDSAAVAILNVPPSANANGPYSTTAGSAVTLNGSGSDILSDTLTYAWDLDDDGAFETPGQSVTFTQSATGTYTVVLQVSDEDGGAGTDTTTVQVNSLFPLAWLGLPFILTRLRKMGRRGKRFNN